MGFLLVIHDVASRPFKVGKAKIEPGKLGTSGAVAPKQAGGYGEGSYSINLTKLI